MESGATMFKKNHIKAKQRRSDSQSKSKHISRRKSQSDSSSTEQSTRHFVEKTECRSTGNISEVFIHSRAQQIETELQKHRLSAEELDSLRQDLLEPLDFQALLFQILRESK